MRRRDMIWSVSAESERTSLVLQSRPIDCFLQDGVDGDARLKADGAIGLFDTEGNAGSSGSSSARSEFGDRLRIGGVHEVDVVAVTSNDGSRVHSFRGLQCVLEQIVGSDKVVQVGG